MMISAWNLYYLGPFKFLPASIPVSWCCFHKLKQHKVMLDQMSHFDLRNAKCSLETDRIILMEQILSLFDHEKRHVVPTLDSKVPEAERLLPQFFPQGRVNTKEETVDRFNAYVQGTLRDTMVTSQGEI
mmetsp:Transcript_6287/g.7150  ORF Transcript_6287/g.7150 Transcript_6287/m.7150 type:complete len:129 (-) Transcript_6287:7-393(-)